MKLLLDTHIFLWSQAEPERLGDHLSLVQDPRNELFVSATSSLEIAIKYQLGKLSLPEAPARYVPARMRAIGAQALALGHSHALAVADLPRLHGDPFDRLLVTQAMSLDLTLLTADAAVTEYPVATILV